ncbi:hypothetical protein CesoFtcFv8_008387 [Champsocephalus esox]|uniref:Uncharacterized protein n=1 Tax=Champsocephalus esox TaxID=159716 RepID=A0AAN8CBC1_9TELE|nr:hypothetical protein CesoFtcFv8_008387 [Champsocephalus esox]
MLANKKASRGEFRELEAGKKGVQSELKTFSIGGKQKKRKRKKQGWFHLDWSQAEPTRAVCSGWSYPIQAGSLWFWEASRSCQVPAGSPPEAQVLGIDEGEVGTSLVCIGSVLSLAVVPTALQKLHKCVTQNTTELLQDTGGHKEHGHALDTQL